MATFQLEIITPISKVLSEEVEYIRIRTIDGDIGILPSHSPLVAPLVPTRLLVRKSKEEESDYFISGGFMEISNNIVTILADSFELPKEIDVVAEKEKLASIMSEIETVEGTNFSEENKKEEKKRKLARLMLEVKKSEVKIQICEKKIEEY
ncbi:ATP synthase F1 subunit epsilon [Fusobacterium sp. PH5-44]|uniref:ATP synthase F1 subunit epsilon n=1 Tax=unclassified Fusobacterium TaxID=2648384 RepID=UPI003D22A21A